MKKAKPSHGCNIVSRVMWKRRSCAEHVGSRGGIWGLRRVEKLCSSCNGEFDRGQLKINIRVAEQCRAPG